MSKKHKWHKDNMGCTACDFHSGTTHSIRTNPFDPQNPFIFWEETNAERLAREIKKEKHDKTPDSST